MSENQLRNNPPPSMGRQKIMGLLLKPWQSAPYHCRLHTVPKNMVHLCIKTEPIAVAILYELKTDMYCFPLSQALFVCRDEDFVWTVSIFTNHKLTNKTQ